MSERISAIVPVKDGARYLRELLAALAREGADEVLVIDSGSRDDSTAIAREAGATLLEIPPDEFGHGRTRNLAAEHASGDVIAFLTQDATPVPGWLAALREAFALGNHVGAVFGPHLPRPDTSPMIARELTEFFATFAPRDAPPRLFGPEDPTFLSNVNAAYRRACWAEIRFEEVAYSEDQAFGRALAAHPRWRKAYAPRAAVLHAHDYPPLEFMRRYFDEYRGLRETIGHVEPLGVRATLHDVRALVAGDRRYMAERGVGARERARWTARSVVHHGGRKAFSALGSRAHALPGPVQRRLSLEGRAAAAPPAPARPVLRPHPAGQVEHEYEVIARVLRDGPAELLQPYPGMADRERLHVAFAIPTFNVGSGGHNIIFQLVLRLERMGHTCSIWVHDLFNHRRNDGAAVMRREIVQHFAPVRAPVFKEFEDWYGADVVVATGWQTVYPVLGLPGCRARAYLINDHEPEFYATSLESEWAEMTYGQGLHGIAGSPWLRDLYVERYGGQAGTFQYGVDHTTYRPRPAQRRRDTVIFYARYITPRRAVGLGILALSELRRRRPDLRIVMFGVDSPLDAPFPYEHLGVAGHEALSWMFSEATVGLCLSMTNYSLIPQEMLACGLPCVDLDRPSARSVFGDDGPVRLAAFDPDALADAVERLLDDEAEWEHRSRQGLEFVASHTWDAAAEQVERELRRALRLRER
jgi:glycosyltransferase involved in cell wall biosynthesis